VLLESIEVSLDNLELTWIAIGEEVCANLSLFAPELFFISSPVEDELEFKALLVEIVPVMVEL
jgi:hypothetical protein